MPMQFRFPSLANLNNETSSSPTYCHESGMYCITTSAICSVAIKVTVMIGFCYSLPVNKVNLKNDEKIYKLSCSSNALHFHPEPLQLFNTPQHEYVNKMPYVQEERYLRHLSLKDGERGDMKELRASTQDSCCRTLCIMARSSDLSLLLASLLLISSFTVRILLRLSTCNGNSNSYHDINSFLSSLYCGSESQRSVLFWGQVGGKRNAGM